MTKFLPRECSITSTLTLAVLLALTSTTLSQSRAPRRLAAVHLSDGQVLHGDVLLTPGIDFKLTTLPKAGQKFTQTRSFNVNLVKEMSFAPFTLSDFSPERVAVPFKWDEVDRTKKIITGKPYPIREVSCSVKFSNGEEMTGVLASTVLYLEQLDPDGESPGDTRRFILKSKQTGEQNQKLADLVYVTRIRMLDEGTKVAAKLNVRLLACKLGPKDELSSITKESLEAVPTKPAGKPDLYEVGSTFGDSIFVAARKGDKYIVGWPEEGTQKTGLFKAVEKNVHELRDYFNERKLLGVLPNKSGTQVLSLVSLRRRVPPNAYKGDDPPEFDEKGNPLEFFRVSMWLWKRDPESGQMILARRGSFFRVRVDAKQATPIAEVSQELWPVVMEGDRVTVGTVPGRTPQK